MTARDTSLRVLSVVGAIIGYGFLALFVALVGHQVWSWFRDDAWTHIGVGDFVREGLERCCVREGSDGSLARFSAWLDVPDHWLGLHRAFEWIPASFALFALSILGNALFIYCRDRLRTH